jgi:hypothetical protein
MIPTVTSAEPTAQERSRRVAKFRMTAAVLRGNDAPKFARAARDMDLPSATEEPNVLVT